MTADQKLIEGRFILASSSPRRKRILDELGIPFEVISPDINEIPWPNETPASYVLRMSHEKAEAAAAHINPHEPLMILAADTEVILEGVILGKPADPDEAVRMLHSLSGKKHVVMTGICLIRRDRSGEVCHGDAVRTTVQFRDISDEEIHEYTATGEPMDKAGAYAIQGGAAGMVEQIDGSYSNIVGLPKKAVLRLIKQVNTAFKKN